jgi:putative ABC transport system permease protein
MLILYLADVVIVHLPLSRCQHLSPSWRMALDNIKRMAAIRRSFIMACGFAYTIMFMIGMVGTTLKNNINQHTTDQTPRYFIIDIAHDQLDAIMSFISTHSHMSAHTVPMMRGRLVAIKDLPIDSGHIDESARWIVEGDRGMTYARELPEGSQLIDGQWWPPFYQGEALVSIEQGAATALHLAPNDVVSFNILGKNLRARIANIRKVNWQSLGINFVFVFSPNSFQNLPFNDLMTLNAPPDAPEELTFIRDFNQAFPDPTLIPVRDALDAIAGTLSQLQLALLAAMSVIFGAALLAVLASLSTGYRLRLYETAIMRVLGARRRHIALSLIIENALLSLYALVIGLILGCTGAFALLHFVFGLTNPGINALTLIIALAITLAMSIQISYLTLNKFLSQPPARALAEN